MNYASHVGSSLIPLMTPEERTQWQVVAKNSNNMFPFTLSVLRRLGYAHIANQLLATYYDRDLMASPAVKATLTQLNSNIFVFGNSALSFFEKKFWPRMLIRR